MKRQIQVSFEEQSFILKYPNVGQILDIESYKQLLTNNAFSQLKSSSNKMQNYAAELAEAVSILMVLIPNLKDKLTVKSITDLEADKAKKIISVYRKTISPWFEEIQEELLKEEDVLEQIEQS